MKLFVLGVCSITLGAVGIILLPAYFWMFVFCVVSGFLCQLAAFWQARREHIVAIRKIEEDDLMRAEIQRQYKEIDEADGESKVELLKALLVRMEEM